MNKRVKVFAFFLKINNEKKKIASLKSSFWHNVAKWAPSATTPWTLTLVILQIKTLIPLLIEFQIVY